MVCLNDKWVKSLAAPVFDLSSLAVVIAALNQPDRCTILNRFVLCKLTQFKLL
jgi:hypothetical protein